MMIISSITSTTNNMSYYIDRSQKEMGEKPRTWLLVRERARELLPLISTVAPSSHAPLSLSYALPPGLLPYHINCCMTMNLVPIIMTYCRAFCSSISMLSVRGAAVAAVAAVLAAQPSCHCYQLPIGYLGFLYCLLCGSGVVRWWCLIPQLLIACSFAF